MNNNEIVSELEALVNEGNRLFLALLIGDKECKETLIKKKVDLTNLPSFTNAYEPWYTKCYRLVNRIAPYRLLDFEMLYKCEKKKEPICDSYCISNAVQGGVWNRGGTIIAKPVTAASKLQQQIDIVASLKSLLCDYFYMLETELQSNLFDSEIESAYELLKKGFLRSAGVVAGVVLERHLKNVCSTKGVVLAKKNPCISDYNEKLKESGVIDVVNWRKIQYLADIRNLCGHDKDSDPTKDQVKELLDGTKFVICNIL